MSDSNTGRKSVLQSRDHLNAMVTLCQVYNPLFFCRILDDKDLNRSLRPWAVLPRKDDHCMLVGRGRTGFDSSLEAQAACRGWFVGLVKNRAKTNKRRSPRSRSRGLIDRDVWSWTPATAPNVDSRLIGRRSDRAGR